MFRKLWIDAIFGTVFILVFIWLVDNITNLKIFDIFDPIGVALDDVKITDVVYSQLREPLPPDESIVIVNIGELPRAGVGEIINIVNSYDPAVVALYSDFSIESDDMGDSLFEAALAQTKNLLLSSKLVNYNPELESYESINNPLPRFAQHGEVAFANLMAPDAEWKNLMKNTREFSVMQSVNGEEQIAFAIKLAELYNPEKAKKFLDRDNNIEVINFRGNVLDFGGSRFGTMFYALDLGQVFMEDFDPGLLKGRIVMLCYMGTELGDELTTEDKFFTPLNPKYAGKSNPDMFGGVIHANITAMILNEDYIDRMTSQQAKFLAVLILFINVSLFSLIYKTIPIWYDGATKTLQLIQVIFLMYLTIQVFDSFNYELDLTLTIIAVALAGDALEVYYGVIKNTFSKQGRRELMKSKKL